MNQSGVGFTLLLTIAFLVPSCDGRKIDRYPDDWRNPFWEEEAYRVEEIRTDSVVEHGKYVVRSTTSFRSYDRKDRLIGVNDQYFYEYDSLGRVQKEQYCMRTCEVPGETRYAYNGAGQLVEKRTSFAQWTTRDVFQYDARGLLIRETIGSDSLATSILHTYNRDSTRESTTKRSFNTNVDRWLTDIDSFFYDSKKQTIRKHDRRLGEDRLTISRYEYDHENLIRRIDTTITSIPFYKLKPSERTILHVYYGKEEFAYDSEGRVIRHVVYQPDYVTPFMITDSRFRRKKIEE